MENIGVGMVRPHMHDIPDVELPEGYRFRPFLVGDDRLWWKIQDSANGEFGGLSPNAFITEFGGHEDELPTRSWFVLDDRGREVASITAWWREGRPDQGLIHWVAVLPDQQGKGLGKAIMTKAMNRLAEEYSTAYLGTSSARIAAIKVYLDFGFLPDMERDRAEDAWAEVRACLTHPVLGNA